MCTDGSLFQNHLNLLGKTNMSTQEEMALICPRPPAARTRHRQMPNRVFLYEQTQLNDPNETRSALFHQDMARFLGMKQQSLQDKYSEKHQASGKKNDRSPAISICDDSYEKLRAELMKNARTASLWIRNYFMDHVDVYVSSPNYFRRLLEAWMADPCEDGSKASEKQ